MHEGYKMNEKMKLKQKAKHLKNKMQSCKLLFVKKTNLI